MSYRRLIKNIITKACKAVMPQKGGLRVLMYHSVQNNPSNLNDIYLISSKLFTQQMVLLKEKYQKNISRLKDLEIHRDELKGFLITYV